MKTFFVFVVLGMMMTEVWFILSTIFSDPWLFLVETPRSTRLEKLYFSYQ